jgi:eukaryotic-like serine/threonine-protein kinase
MQVDPKRVQAIFLEAVRCDGATKRKGIIDRQCGKDPDLKRRVEALLLAHDQPDRYLEQPVVSPLSKDSRNSSEAIDPLLTVDTNPLRSDAMTAPPPVAPLLGEGPGARIGPYKLLQEIGEGGMGKVYMAEQVEPVRRRVALKIIKPGMDSAQVIARFESERQALALMDHLNIAKVLDAGATESGRPYFIMELVSGVPITKYCDDAQLNPRERLELFIPVCQAIQHAHQKGIIHRDIKPSNVLVTLYDGKPVAKIIDFGVAKATDQRLTERTMFTQYGSIIGTLEYMSPEQAEMSALGVDTRSDIYSLGVLLYELLTGTTPLERAKLREAGYAEVLKRIREEEPPKPSTRLSESRDALPSISAHRKTEPARLTKLIKGELDWIVMKALEKDRSRRYESASGFARDIQHHLDGDAVEACPPSSSYRLQKFALKHRTGLITAAAFVLLLFIASVFSTYQAVLANRSRREAEAERRRADQLRIAAEANFLKAREAVDEYFTKVSESKLLNVPGLQPLRKELLESSRKYYQEFLEDHAQDPSVRAEAAEAWYRVGFVTMHVQSAKDAIPYFEQATQMYDRLSREHPSVERYSYKLAMCLNDLGNQQADLGREADARRSHERSLEIRKRVVHEHPDVPEYQKELGIGHGVWSERQHIAGLTSESLRSTEQEKAIFERLVRAYPDVADYKSRLASALRSVGSRQRDCGRSAEALAAYQQSLALSEGLVRDHPDDVNYRWGVTSSLGDIGWTHYRLSGRIEDARVAYRKALDLALAIARDNPGLETAWATVASYENELGRVLARLGKPDEALEHYLKALKYAEERQRKNAGSVWADRDLAYLHYEMGRIHLAAGRVQESSAALDRARRMFEAIADSAALDPYNRACALAVCADLVGLGKTGLTPEDQSRRAKFAARAVASLREALSGGHQNPDMIASDIDFDAIKCDEDFKSLLAELRAKQPGDRIVMPGS